MPTSAAKPYSKGDLENALRKIKDDGMPIRQASRQYKISRGTLQNRLHNRTKQSLSCSGPPPILSFQEEEDIIAWLNEHARKGFPRRLEDLMYLVKEFLDKTQRENPFTDNLPGRTWFKCFLRRHPKTSLRVPEGVSDASSKVSETDIRDWFKNIGDYFGEKGLSTVLEDPTRIYNADETSFQLCPKTGKVLAPKGSQNVYEVNRGQEKESITVLCNFSAAGDMLTPLIVLPYKRIPNDIREAIPESFAIDKTDSGWMHKQTFYDYVKNVFHPELKQKQVKFPVVLFVDGHKSHVSVELSELCLELQIELICLYPNATRIIQPADVSCFKPLKNGWNDAVMIWRRTNVDKVLTKTRFGHILDIVMTHCITKESIVNGFIATGLYPFDANAIDYSKCLGKNSNHKSSESNEINENPIEAASESIAVNGTVVVIDLKRFGEIVGENILSELSQFDHRVKTCSSTFALLHQIYQELSGSGLPECGDLQSSLENKPVEIDFFESNFEHITGDIVDTFDTNFGPDDVGNFNMELVTDYGDDVNTQLNSQKASTPEVIRLPPIERNSFDKDSEFKEFENSVNVEITDKEVQINMNETKFPLTDLLVLPATPKRKRTKKYRSTRLLVMTSDLFIMEEKLKIQQKNAELKAKADKKIMREDNKIKRLQAIEMKKQQRLEDNLKKAAEKEQKAIEKAAEKEQKIKQKATEKEERAKQKATEKILKRRLERNEQEKGNKTKKKRLTTDPKN